MAANNPATGAPTISGTAQVGETLTASTTGIADSDGLAFATFTYQWIKLDSNLNDSDISGATGSTYTLVAADAGTGIKVRVSFTDDAGNTESLTNESALIVMAANSPATGAPTISGTAQVGETLTASTTGIADSDGLAFATFTYQWIKLDSNLNDSDISGATGSTYTLVAADAGTGIKVRVSFTDDAGNTESLTNESALIVMAANNPATGAPTISGTAQVGETLTASTTGIADSDGLAFATFTYQWIKLDSNLNDSDISGATGSTYTLVAADAGTGIKVRVSFTDDAGNTESLTNESALIVMAANNPATGAPTISGTAQVGETLTASTTGIADSDGLAFATFTYQWIKLDSNLNDSDISGATGSTYTLVAADAGKAISGTARVRVSFTDDAGNTETLTSGASAAVTAAKNPASGTARVGETLTAETKDIADSDGLTSATFAYQWLADDADIAGATGSTYTLVAADAGKAIKVQVSFTDDAGNAETLTSGATTAAALPPLTASAHDVPASHDGSAAFTFELHFSEEIPLSYVTLRDHAFTVTGGTVTKARRLERGKNVRWEITVDPSGDADVSVSLPVTTDCDSQGAICTGDGRRLSNGLALLVPGPAPAPPPPPPTPDPTPDPTPTPLTAQAAEAPAQHDGDAFTFELRFSETPADGFSYKTLRGPRVHGDGGRGGQGAAAGAGQERPVGDHRQAGWRRDGHHRAARHRGLCIQPRHLHSGRQAALQPVGADGRGTGRVGHPGSNASPL